MTTLQMLEQAALPAAPLLEPVTQQFLDALAASGEPAIHTLTALEARRRFSRIQSGTVGKPAVRCARTSFPVGPRGSVGVRIVRPECDAGALPVIVYLHGGGWVAGDAETHDRLVRELANGVPAAVVFVEFSRAPEARFPVSHEEAYAATQYVAECASAFGLDGTRLALAGDGAGGNLAAVVSLLARQRRGPRIALQVLFCPVTDAALDSPSAATFADGPWLTRSAMQWFWSQYLPDASARVKPLASPLRASHEELRNLPDALVITAECDPLRDEGEAYARRLTEAGVRVTATRYNGTIHDFVVLNAIADTPAARAAIAQSIAALRAALE